MEKNKEDEAAKTANASETTNDDTSSDKENLEESKETKVESKEDLSSDYLEEDSEEDVDYKKRYGDSTREFQALKTKADRTSLALKNLEKLAKVNPKIMSEIDIALGKDSKKGGENQPTSTLIQETVDKALEPIKKVTQDLEDKNTRAKIKTLATFEKKNPNLFPSGATKEEKRTIRQTIGRVANALVETGMPFKKAVSRAYLTINPKSAIQKGKDEAYLEKLDQGQAGFSRQVSAEGKKVKKPSVSKRELEIADKLDPSGKVRKSLLEQN